VRAESVDANKYKWDKSKSTFEVRKADYATSAGSFVTEFIANREAADAKYRGKRVEITGEVLSVLGGKQAIVNFPFVKKTPEDAIGVCVAAKLRSDNRQKGLMLSEKQKVKITGNYEGDLVGYMVSLSECIVEEISKSELMAVNAEDMAKEFIADFQTATAKYQGKDVVIAGKIDELLDGMVPAVKLHGHGDLAVSIYMGGAEVESLKKGQSVRLRGRFLLAEVAKKEIRFQMGFVVEAK
jgi:hypothetical protein